MKEKKTVFLGDSITRGYGVSSGEGWVELLHRGKNINHGIDGDTTAGMLRRFSAHVVREQPERVVIMGGVNDLSEGERLGAVIDRLQTMYDRAAMRGIAVVPAICVMPDYDMLLENDWAPYYPGIQTLPAEFGAAGGLDSRLCEGKWMAVLRFCP